MAKEENINVPFLDVMVKRTEEETLQHAVFRRRCKISPSHDAEDEGNKNPTI